MKKFEAISSKHLESLRKDYLANDQFRVVRNALTESPLDKISKPFESKQDNPDLFSIDIKTLPVNDQQHSG